MDKLEREVAEETGIFSSRRGQEKLKVEDLFGVVDAEGSGGVDDLFSAVRTLPKSRAQRDDDLFDIGTREPTTLAKTPSAPSKMVDLFEAPPEDVFASTAQPSRNEVDLFAPSKEEKRPAVLDDLFAEVSP